MSVGLAAILFAVFGIFYQVYATYCVAATEGRRAPIANSLITLCKMLVVLIALNVIGSTCALVLLLPNTAIAWFLGGITAISVIGIVAMTFWLAFEGMD